MLTRNTHQRTEDKVRYYGRPLILKQCMHSPTRQPKYIEKLMAAAEARKLDFELVQERKAQREREQEGEMFGDKEAFVTGAFKQRMIERQAYEKKQKIQDAIDGMACAM